MYQLLRTRIVGR